MIEAGKLGASEDIKDPRYADAIANAKELDRLTVEMNKKKEAGNKVETTRENLQQRQLELTSRLQEANARITDPLERKSSSAFRSLRRELEEYIRDVERYYGRDSAEYQSALDYKTQMLKNFRGVELSEQAAGWAQENETLRRSMMVGTDARRQALDEEIALIDRAVAEFAGAEEDKVLLVAAAEERKKLLRDQYNREVTPFGKQMEEWGDITNNLADASTRWMDSMADGIGDLLTGTNSLKDTLANIGKDMARMAVKWAFSAAMGGTGPGKGGGGSKAVGTAHTGGVIGQSSLTKKMISPDVFANAARMHTGGIVQDRLGPGEVPIIAKKNEGVFTPEQMQAMGGFGGASISIGDIHTTVQGSAGSPSQNQDLAERTAREMTKTIEGIAAAQIAKQLRPGNMGNSRSRN